MYFAPRLSSLQCKCFNPILSGYLFHWLTCFRGGGRIRDEATNKMVCCEDALEKAMNINGIRKAHECRALVAVVAGEDHAAAALPRARRFSLAGWTCLNHKCNSFFQLPSIGTEVDVNPLTYTDAFLNERTPFIGPLPKLKPDIPSFSGLHGTEKFLRRGFVCPECGHCSRRIYWNRFTCEDCPYQLESVMLPYPKHILLAEEEAIFNSRMARRRKQKNKINVVRKDNYEELQAHEDEVGREVDVKTEGHDADDRETDDMDIVPEEPHTDATTEDANMEHENETIASAKVVNEDETFSITLNPSTIGLPNHSWLARIESDSTSFRILKVISSAHSPF